MHYYLISRTSEDGTKTFGYAEPVVGEPHGVSIGMSSPYNTIIEATAHTHPNSNEFSGQYGSDGDIPNAISRD